MCRYFVGDLEELKNIVVCLCRGDYLTALKQKTAQRLLQTASAGPGMN